MAEYEVGDWVRHKPHAAVPEEQRVKPPMLITEVSDAGITCTFDGMEHGAVHIFSPADVEPFDPAAELKVMKAKSDQVKASQGPHPEHPIEMKKK